MNYSMLNIKHTILHNPTLSLCQIIFQRQQKAVFLFIKFLRLFFDFHTIKGFCN